MLDHDAALVLFSGGQDSATCLAWALERYTRVETVGFDYRQRHAIELEVRHSFRESIASLHNHWGNRLGMDHHIDARSLADIGQTAMTETVAFRTGSDGLPNTFVPGRNLLFLTYAAAIAYRRGIRTLVTGVCETDFSGYPDCRDDTLKAMQVALNLGMDCRFVVETPLMWVNKAGTWAMAHALGGEKLVGLILEKTHTCYAGDRDHRHPWGYGCGTCPACELRARGWDTWQQAALQ
ncbi:7-cyano-7-deazaguanine synthase QueC [Haematospirillum sp. H1815]|uniref:7-cyano-7-deazaguanine synthase QueC n=1 Tax=Haematospirillum sp. H1815 TaxID=2723108 RepID=UPI00143B1185|nr:7-cyano-7-deazaguanine synthase QueC [Haematospirillum sp. H1815]NKD77546.1 7-cyano-7-deazaguanine synthase QueC [Haematospirillum sp. H1815]